MDETLKTLDVRNDSTGTLIVQTAEAESAIPVVGALVLVTKDIEKGTDLYGALTTDVNGRTPPLDLPAPNDSKSLDSSSINPYEIYYVRVSHPGYYTEENRMVQIYGGSNSVLQINMIPLAEYPQKDVIVY